MLVGVQLRRLREASGITREAAGYAIRASESKISRMELGRVGFKERDVSDLLTLYGVADQAERDTLLNLVREANAPGWWHRYNDVLPGWFQTYMGLEESASVIRTYEVQFVPGLLQAEGYARAVFRQGNPEAPEREIEQRVDVRMRRRQRILHSGAARLWAVIDEAALRRPIGGPGVMRDQIEHLLRLAKLPHVTIQVMPLSFGGHAAEGGAFTILRFSEPDVSDVVYIENLTGALYLDRHDEVESYQKVMERLCVDSAAPDAIDEVMHDILREVDPPIASGPAIRLPRRVGSVRTAGRSVTTGGTRADGAVLYTVSTPFGVRLLIGKVSGDDPAGTAERVALAFRDLAEHEPMLTGVAERMNTVVAASGRAEDYVTALLVTIRDWEGQAELVCCGHPPPLLVRDSLVSVVDVMPTGPPLGLMDVAGDWSESTTVPFGQGDRLLLHTKSVGQACDAEGRPYPLAERVAGLVHDDPDMTLASLAEDLLRYSDGPLEDGAALLLVQGEPLPAAERESPGTAGRSSLKD
jgi:hypothetical protein